MTRREIHPDDEDLRLLRIEQVLELIPVARSSIYRMIEAKTFPAPEKLGSVSVWSNQEIRAWKDRKFPKVAPAPRGEVRKARDNAGLI
jgi:predicted DNA-binding transcriptional regulator AlpA